MYMKNFNAGPQLAGPKREYGKGKEGDSCTIYADCGPNLICHKGKCVKGYRMET